MNRFVNTLILAFTSILREGVWARRVRWFMHMVPTSLEVESLVVAHCGNGNYLIVPLASVEGCKSRTEFVIPLCDDSEHPELPINGDFRFDEVHSADEVYSGRDCTVLTQAGEGLHFVEIARLPRGRYGFDTSVIVQNPELVTKLSIERRESTGEEVYSYLLTGMPANAWFVRQGDGA